MGKMSPCLKKKKRAGHKDKNDGKEPGAKEFSRYESGIADCPIIEDFQFDLGKATFFHAQFGGRGGGEINDPVAVEGPPVVDVDLDRFVVMEVGHQYLGADRQGAMGGSHFLLVEPLATGGFAASEPVGINGGHPTHGWSFSD